MKKFLIITIAAFSILFFTGVSYSQATFGVKASVDLMGESELDVPDLDPGDVDTGFGIGGEVIFPINEQLIAGGGVVYQLPRGIDEEAP